MSRLAITANRLTDGRVIYRTPEHGWSTELTAAWRLEGEAAERALLEAEAEGDVIVGPYLIELGEAGPAGKKRIRESIRLTGPTAGSTKRLN